MVVDDGQDYTYMHRFLVSISSRLNINDYIYQHACDLAYGRRLGLVFVPLCLYSVTFIYAYFEHCYALKNM